MINQFRIALESSTFSLSFCKHRGVLLTELLIQPSPSLGRTIRELGIRRLIRQGFGRRIIEKISRRELVKASTYREYERRIEEL